MPVFAWKGEIAGRLLGCTYQALSHKGGKGPQLVVDDGGDVTLLIHKGYELENGDKWVNTPSGNHEEQVIKDLLKQVSCRRQAALAQGGEGMARRFRRDDDGRAPALQDDGEGQAAGSGDQRERLGDQVEVRQPVWLPRVAGRRHQARDGRDGGGQGGGGLRIRRCGQGLLRTRCAAWALA